MPPDRVAVVLLAAGRSTRFGEANKLLSDWKGRPLMTYAADAMRQVPFGYRFAVVQSGAAGVSRHLEGFELLENDAPEAGMGRSVSLGARSAQLSDADALLIVLADMPNVTGALLRIVAAQADDIAAMLVCSDGHRRAPPALFGRTWFGTLMQASGDVGARDLLRQAAILAVSPNTLRDIDLPEK